MSLNIDHIELWAARIGARGGWVLFTPQDFKEKFFAPYDPVQPPSPISTHQTLGSPMGTWH